MTAVWWLRWIGRKHIGCALIAIIGDENCTFWDAQTGKPFTEHPMPEPGRKHVGYRRYARKLPTLGTDTSNDEVSPMS